MRAPSYPQTPDGRYMLVRGRLWRLSNPDLPAPTRERLVGELMSARRAVRSAKRDPDQLRAVRASVDTAKRSLGERGPVWWTDGAPDFNRHLAKNTPYAAWYQRIQGKIPKD
jgi:peptidoglycan/xylan/chitin deacetylase (PgdA/CDA1 family)